MKQRIIFFLGVMLSLNFAHAQGIEEYTGGYKIKFNEDGSKYLRIIAWGQFWARFLPAGRQRNQ